MPTLARISALLLYGVMQLFLSASIGSGDEFPELYNSEDDRQSLPMDAQEAADTFAVPDGFRVNVFASEPDVQNPIASAWDSRGRLWIAENFTYAETEMRFDLELRDRLLILEDSDGDGKADKRTVFSDQLQMLTSVEVAPDGVWLMCPPVVLFVPDRDKNDIPDSAPEVILDGFEVAKENYHNFANGLRFGPDGWLYGRCGGSCPGRVGLVGTPFEERIPIEGGIWRFHPKTKKFEVLCHGTTNPWGHDWNEQGQAFFINTVNGHLWHLIPGAHFVRPFTLDPNTKTYELIDMHADHWHFDTGKKWQDSRGGAANDYGGGHAHSGMMIYLGDNWPKEYRNDLFTLNFHGRRINREALFREGSGYVAKHEKDLFLSSDSFFRGIDLTYGPDGSVFVLDWSDTGECHEHTGVHRTSGRIYRVTFQGVAQSRTLPEQIDDLNNEQLIELHRLDNEWWVRQARLLLSSRHDRGLIEEPHLGMLRAMSHDSDERLACRATLTLDALDVDSSLFDSLLHHSSEHVRVLALRAITDHWPIDNVFSERLPSFDTNEIYRKQVAERYPMLLELAKSDESSLVRMTLASTLQRLPVDHRVSLASAIASRASEKDDHNLPLLVWYGLIPTASDDAEALAKAVPQFRWPKLVTLASRRLAERLEDAPRAVETLLSASLDSESPVQQSVLIGLRDGLKGWIEAAKPASWDSFVQAVQINASEEAQKAITDLTILFGEGISIEEAKSIVLDNNADIGLRQSALEALVRKRPEGLREICLAVLSDARINLIAADGLAFYDDPQVASALINRYRSFRSPNRSKIIAILCSRKSFAIVLLNAIAEKKIPLEDLTPYDARQLLTLDDPQIRTLVAEHWGDLKESSQAKQERIAELKQALAQQDINAANKSAGRVLFSKHCSKCHRMYGEGEKIGPDLTGSDRANLDYLLGNIVDPSAIVSKDYRMSIIALNDDRIFNGLIVSKNEKTLTIQTQNELLTLAHSEVAEVKQTTLSPMPDGLLDQLTEEEISNLIAYLRYPAQVPIVGPPQ